MAEAGHNVQGGVDTVRLDSIIKRIERLQEEKQALQGDISDIFAEAKSGGFDCGVIRELLRRRKKAAKDPAGFEEESALLDVYERAMGLL